ncbi:unnamed protein product [Closterium sp. NIES-53]
MAAQELRWLTYLLTDLGEAPRSPPVLYQRGQLRLAYVTTQANSADFFTKAIQPCDHQRFCTMLGLLALPFFTGLFTRYPFSSSEATAKAPLDEMVMDVVGPLKLGAAGAEYFLTIVDVYTRMTWVYVLSKKSDVAETVKTDWLPKPEGEVCIRSLVE